MWGKRQPEGRTIGRPSVAILLARLRGGDRGRGQCGGDGSPRALTRCRLRRVRRSLLRVAVTECSEAQQNDGNDPRNDPTGVVTRTGLSADITIGGQVLIAFKIARV